MNPLQKVNPMMGPNVGDMMRRARSRAAAPGEMMGHDPAHTPQMSEFAPAPQFNNPLQMYIQKMKELQVRGDIRSGGEKR